MYIPRYVSKTLMMAIVWITLLVVMSACVPPAAAPAAGGGQATAGAAAGGEAAPAAESTTITAMFLLSDAEIELIVNKQIEEFRASYPGIEVQAEVIPFRNDYRDKLFARLAAGDVPDIVVLPGPVGPRGNFWTWEQQIDWLQSLNEYGGDDYVGTFTTSAQKAMTFEGKYYGVPWRRNRCLPDFMNLAITSYSKYPKEAFEFIKFLAEERQQQENFDYLEWYPTLTSVAANNRDKIGCAADVGRVIVPLPPADLAIVKAEVDGRGAEFPLLDEKLTSLGIMSEKLDFNLERPTGLLKSYTSGPYQSRSAEESPVIAAIVPVTGPVEFFGDPIFPGELEKGVIVGALLVNEQGELPVGPGVYGILWTGTEISLVDSAGTPYPLKDQLEDINDIIESPFVTLEQGSWYLCIYVYRYGGCIYIYNN